MDWNEAMPLIDKMSADGMHRDALLIASGYYLRLRVSDLLSLKWEDLLSDEFTVTEKKTGKQRTLRVAESLQNFASKSRKEQGNPPEDA